MRHVAGQRLILVRAGVVRVVHRIAIQLVIPGDVAAHIADDDVLAVSDVAGLVVPVIAVTTRAERTCRADVRRALQPSIRTGTRRNGHAELHHVDLMHHRGGFELLPLVVIAHAKPTERLASGRGSFETNLATVREGAHLRISKAGENQFAHARIAAAGRARAAGRSLNAAIRRTNFAIAIVADFRELHDAVATEGQFAVVVASVRCDTVAVVAFFTSFDHSVAAGVRRIRQVMAIAHTTSTACTTTAARTAAAAAAATDALIKYAARLTGLDALVRTRAGARLRRIRNARLGAVAGIAAARLQSERR